MKTLLSFVRWIGVWAGVVLPDIPWIVVALIPSIIYGVVWWFISKTLWPVLSAVVGGAIFWIPLQILWPFILMALFVGWNGLTSYVDSE